MGKFDDATFIRYSIRAMKKQDRRITRTRQKLADALITLSLEHGYENLTIRAVTEHAVVGYNTFYRHYLNLDELLVEILKKAFRELSERAAQAKTPLAESVGLYTFTREHQDLMRVYVSLPWKHPARQEILSIAKKIMRARYAQQGTSNAPLDLSIDQFLKAKNSLIVWYLDHMDDYAPEQAAFMHNDLVVNALEHLALVQRPDWKPTGPKE